MRTHSLSLFFFFNSSSLDLFFHEATTYRELYLYLNQSEDFSITVSTRCRRRRLNFCETTDVARARVSSRFFTFLAFLFRKRTLFFSIARSDLIIDPIID